MAEKDMQKRNDHDLLLKLDANFTSFVTGEFKNFREQLLINIKELKDGYARTLADHALAIADQNKRLTQVEQLLARTQPDQQAKDLRDLKQDVHDFVVRADTARFFIGVITAIIGGLVFFFMTQLPNFLRTIGVIR